MEKTEEKKSRVRLVINLVIWAGLILYLAHGRGYLDQSLFDDGKRFVADLLVKMVDTLGSSSGALRLQVEAGKLYFAIGDDDAAFAVLDPALPRIAELDNVQQRRYADVYFVLGEITAADAQFARARGYLLQGLRLEPNNLMYQLYLGDMYMKAGDTRLAREHYLELLETPGLAPEQRAMIRISMPEGDGVDRFTEESRKQLAQMAFLDYPLITLVPINKLPDAVVPTELCLILESVFRMGCVVKSPITFAPNEAGLRNGQIDAVAVIAELESTFARPGVAPIVGIMSEDIFSGTARFVFSTQALDSGYGVVSTFRFFQTGRYSYANENIYNRRLTVQLISVVGQLLGFERPLQPYCPLAYPNSLDEFLLKRAALCPSTQSSLDELLAELGTQEGIRFSKFSSAKISRILEVKARYGIDG
ncbi:MAG: hypothetical protein KDI17_14845 [Halioglobus sp.]|nr:hypothetical protein [Halioglobus sp.]